MKDEYFKFIRNENKSIGMAYLNVYEEILKSEKEFDKVSLIKFIEALKETNVIDGRANDILLKFIKPM